MWTTLGLSLFGISRDVLGAYNEYTIGKGLRQNIGSVKVLIPTLTRALGAQHTSALVSSCALPAGVAMLGLIAYQGSDASEKLGKIHDTIDAQTALVSAEKFSKHVWKYLQQRIDETPRKTSGVNHWFFVYHPDTNWHSDFHDLLKRDGKLKRLIGISSELPHLCYFMMHIRTYLRKMGSKKRIVFHLLMPAYRRMYIEEKLAFNPVLYPLVLEGHIYSSSPFVTLRVINKLEKNAFNMREINNLLDDAPSVWNLWNIFASEVQTLSLGKDDSEEDYEDGDAYYDSDSSERGSSITQPTYVRHDVFSLTRNGGKAAPKSRPRTGAWVRRRPRRNARA